MYIRTTVPSNRERFVRKLSEAKCVEIKQFVVVTDDPEFCPGTTLLYIDTRNTCAAVKERALFLHSVFRKPFEKKDKFSTFVAFLGHVIQIPFHKFSSTSTSFYLGKICTLYFRPVPTWHSQPTTQKRLRNFRVLFMP